MKIIASPNTYIIFIYTAYVIFLHHFSQAAVSVIHLVVSWEARCSSVVRAFAHGAMGRQIDPSCGRPIELFLVPASVP